MFRDRPDSAPVDPDVLSREAVGALLGASMTPARWPAALETVSRFLDVGSVAVLGAVGGGSDESVVWASDRLPLATPWDDMPPEPDTRRRLSALPSGSGLCASLCVGDDPDPVAQLRDGALPFLRYCRDCSACDGASPRWSQPPSEVPLPHAVLCAFPPDGGRLPGLSGDRLKALLPFVAHALRVAFRLARERFAIQASEYLFDRAEQAVLFCDASGRVLHRNAEAHRLVAPGGELYLQPDHVLSVRNAAAHAALHRAIEACAGAEASSPALVVPARRSRESSPVVLRIAPLPRNHPFRRPCFGAAVSVVLDNPESHGGGLGEALGSTYGLTRAERRIVIALLDGCTNQDLAMRFEVSIHTVKSQLKSVYAKTGTHRQSDLVRLCMRLQSALP